ncbi:unnamed protein product [Mytilus coruscus]|uniref:Uncharacterized protein n=1 Tax=Mytilus coruscus TaxID=42192 RepID=A0A6J8B7I2_MYTCO|nr:unnamed protein product [Mytilus coruscus]
MAVMVVIHDCEQKSKTAMEKIIDDKIEGRQIQELSLTGVGPDAVHIGKCIAGSLSNWWLLLDNYRINLIILRMLRQTRTIMGNVFRENISLDSVQRKDRQATAAIAEISSEKVLDCLHNSDNDVVEPVDICLSDDPSVLYVADRVGVIYSVRLHYPAEVKQLAKGLSTPSSIMNLDGILAAHHKDTLKLDISKSTKRNLCEYATFLEITEPEKSNLKTLRQIINRRIEAAGLPRGIQDTVRVLDIDIDAVVPTKLVKVDKDLFFVADQKTKSILQVSVKRKVAAYGYDLFGTSLYSISVPDMSGCFGLAYCSNYLYLADHTAVILKTGTEICNQPHGIAIVGTELIYSDVGKRALYKIKDIENVSLNQPDVVLFAGKGEEGHEDGLGKYCQFSQPSGICTEGNTVFVIDSGSKNIRLVTSLSAMHKYLSVLRDIYKSFSVHTEILGSGHSDDIRMSISKLKDVESFFENSTSEAKTLYI